MRGGEGVVGFWDVALVLGAEVGAGVFAVCGFPLQRSFKMEGPCLGASRGFEGYRGWWLRGAEVFATLQP